MIVVNVKNSSCDESIGRDSMFGNPFTMKDKSNNERTRVIKLHKEWMNKGLEGEEIVFWLYGRSYSNVQVLNNLERLRGKKCGCWCAPLACHGDYLKEILEKS